MYLLRIAILLIRICVGAPALAVDDPWKAAWDAGFTAWSHGDWERAKELLEPVAKAGHPGAAYTLGFMYEKGQKPDRFYPHFFPQSFQEAAKWYRVAAERDHVFAQVRLGQLYRDGKGVIQDGEQAVYWFRKAADRGFYQGQLALADIYVVGKVVPRDWNEAAKWFRIAAEHNSAVGQAMLGRLYLDGLGVPKDEVLAYMWFNLAIAHYIPVDDDDKKELESMTNTRSEIAARLSPDQLAQAQKLSREWNPVEEKSDSNKQH